MYIYRLKIYLFINLLIFHTPAHSEEYNDFWKIVNVYLSEAKEVIVPPIIWYDGSYSQGVHYNKSNTGHIVTIQRFSFPNHTRVIIGQQKAPYDNPVITFFPNVNKDYTPPNELVVWPNN